MSKVDHAKLTSGSTMRHIVEMCSTVAVGLTTLFFVDLLDIFFLSRLGHDELAAAVGFAGSILFFTTSICIGFSIAAGALISKSLGEQDQKKAARYFVNNLFIAVVSTSLLALGLFLEIPTLLKLVGTSPDTFTMATNYLKILIPSMPILAAAMVCGASLRSMGEAKLSMMSIIAGGIVNLILDPIFIFVLSLDVKGAAIASFLCRIAILVVAGYGVIIKHKLVAPLSFSLLRKDLIPITVIAIPAILANLATPIGNAYVTRSISDFGDSFVAGFSVIFRVTPVAFGLILALDGAVGPIIGQNYGANLFPRVKSAIRDAFTFSLAYVAAVSVILYFLQGIIIRSFDLHGDAEQIVTLYFTWFGFSFFFTGLLFIANASFNNLGSPRYATLFNLGKDFIGTIPFVYYGAEWGGVLGILIGMTLGNALFGIAAIIVAYKHVHKKEGQLAPEYKEDSLILSSTMNPLSSGCTQLGQCRETSIRRIPAS